MNSEEKGNAAAVPEKQEKRKKYFFIALSIAIAVGLWLYVVDSTNPTVTRSYSEIHVEVLNLEEMQNRELTPHSDLDLFVNVRVSGRRSKLVRMTDRELVATLDLSGCTEGENYVGVNVHTPDSVELVSVDPAQVMVEVEKIITEEKNITVKIDGNVSGKMEAVCLEQELESMNISGAKSQVDQVEELRAVISAGDLQEEAGAFKAEITPVDENGNEVEDVWLPQKEMEVQAQLYAVKTVPLKAGTTGTLPEGLQLVSVKAAEQVTISLPADQADSVEEIRARDIDLSGISRNTTVDMQLNLPEGVRLAEGEELPQAVITVSAGEEPASEGAAQEKSGSQ